MIDLSFSLPAFTSFNSLLIPLVGENPNSLTAHRLLWSCACSALVASLTTASHHTQHSRHTQALFPECSTLSATSKQVLFSPAGTSSSTPTFPSGYSSYGLRELLMFLAKSEGRYINFPHHSPLPSRHRISKHTVTDLFTAVLILWADSATC